MSTALLNTYLARMNMGHARVITLVAETGKAHISSMTATVWDARSHAKNASTVERWGAIERDPVIPGKWRVTAAGERLLAAWKEKLKRDKSEKKAEARR